MRPDGEDSGDFVFAGGNITLGGHSARQVAGLSASSTPAKNLRGIDVPVPEGVTEWTVTFATAEEDAEYAVTIQPNWMTMDRTVDKQAEGFTVAFSAPAPAGAALDWHLLR